MKNRQRNTFRAAMQGVQRAVLQSMKGRKNMPRYVKRVRVKLLTFFEEKNLFFKKKMQLYLTRIESSLAAYNVGVGSFSDNLKKMNVMLNTQTLSNLATWEPRTFKALAALSQVRGQRDGTATPDRARRLPDNTVVGKDPFIYPE